MSFLFARKDNEKIYMFSDSKVTFSPNDEDMLVKKLSIEDVKNMKKFGILKSVIINNKICIGSAGVLEHFNELLEYVDNTNTNLENILNKALEIHIKYNGDTDFIIMSLCDNEKRIFLIKNKMITKNDSCWIGSKDTFEVFQEYRLYNLKIQDKEQFINSKLIYENFNYIIDSDAFDYAIKNSNDDTVGGFSVLINEDDWNFKYSEKFYTVVERSKKVKNGEKIPIYDNAENGGYTLQISESSNIFNAYIYQLNKRIQYICCIDEKGYNHLRIPKQYDVDEEYTTND